MQKYLLTPLTIQIKCYFFEKIYLMVIGFNHSKNNLYYLPKLYNMKNLIFIIEP
jgi:hypothetical protein